MSYVFIGRIPLVVFSEQASTVSRVLSTKDPLSVVTDILPNIIPHLPPSTIVNLTQGIFLYNFRIRDHGHLHWNKPLFQTRLH